MAGAPRKPGAKGRSRGTEAAKGTTAKAKPRRATGAARKHGSEGAKAGSVGKSAPKGPPAGKVTSKRAPAGKATPKRPSTGARSSKKRAASRRAGLDGVEEERRAAKLAGRQQPQPATAARAQPVADVVAPRGEAAERASRRKLSERLLAVFAELPAERSLTEEEREAMSKVSDAARQVVGAEGTPERVVESIAAFVDDVRLGRREEPKSQDVRLGLGVLWGEQLRAQVGWRWVHLTYPDGFASYALVPDDRAFACFPLNRVPEAFRANATNTSARVFDSIRDDALPARKPNAYLVIG